MKRGCAAAFLLAAGAGFPAFGAAARGVMAAARSIRFLLGSREHELPPAFLTAASFIGALAHHSYDAGGHAWRCLVAG